MRSRLPVALLAGLALAGGLGACGSGDASGDVVPRTTPELRPPEATTLGEAPGQGEAREQGDRQARAHPGA